MPDRNGSTPTELGSPEKCPHCGKNVRLGFMWERFRTATEFVRGIKPPPLDAVIFFVTGKWLEDENLLYRVNYLCGHCLCPVHGTVVSKTRPGWGCRGMIQACETELLTSGEMRYDINTDSNGRSWTATP